MGFGLSDDQEMLRDLAQDFAKSEMRPVVEHHDTTGEYPWDVIRKAHERGLMNTHIPERFGGLGLGALDACIISEEIAWGCTGIGTAMEANALALQPVIEGASDALMQKYVAPLTEEPKMVAYAVTEPGAGSDVAGLRSTAVKKGDKYILNGSKMWITNAGVAEWFFVVAYTDKAAKYKGMTAFLVERGWDGVEVGKKEWNMGQRCSDTRGVSFQDVEVPAENVIGAEGMGWKLAMGAFDHTRPVVASAAVGLARSAMEHATKYAMERQTMGVPIAQHQAVSFMIADMAKDIEAARLLVRQAAWMKDNGIQNTMYASMAKAFAADAAHRIASDAVQIFGGYGFNTEYPVEKLLRDSKIFQIYEGTSQIQRLIIAREHFRKSM
ncbi:MAG: acyl-CoA dehydrogenase family protein [Alphaproteobacteria bacterium]|nr:acyl-CoA dehydrogenase family protein [Alphaproteobacteria bacterium]MCB9694774.1 acyl-CoA dehydrogenase family protein [Alphaproteobacteria bacterium]